MESDSAQANSPESNVSTQDQTYWRKSLRIVLLILSVWAAVSLGGGILLRDLLDSIMPSIGGAPFGFWVAQQGAIIVFWLLLVIYMVLMNRLDDQFGYREGGDQ